MGLISENFSLIITNSAQEDIDEYIDTIIFTCDAPMTAKKHYDDLYKVLQKIKECPTSNPIRHNPSLFQYGYNVRRANYKKMAIIYTMHNNVVYVHRIVAASMITDL